MCLQTISDERPKDKGVGYKIVYDTEKGFTPLYFGHMTEILPSKIWIDSTAGSIAGHSFSYPKGFHIYTNLASAKKQRTVERRYYGKNRNVVIIKVQYKNAHTRGTQHTQYVVVAPSIKVLKLIK